MAKGGNYERELCYRLSRWWTDGADEEVFWRTSQSGGRATRRQQLGKTATVHQGDICAVKGIGKPLMEVMTLELKRGYPRAILGGLLDLRPAAAQQPYEEWYQQAQEAANRASSFSWLIIHKRNNCEDVVTFPWALLERLRGAGALKSTPVPFMAFSTVIRIKEKSKIVRQLVAKLGSMRLDHFLHGVKPAHVRHVWKTT